tara:strand:+ start:149 stop:943 length:795 start_codon:yes stop_codon:yes gene_type:complete
MTLTAISTIIVLVALLAFSGLSLKTPGAHQRTRCIAAFAGATVATMHWMASRDWGLGLSTALLANILATQLAFAMAMIRTRDILQLGSLLGPYLLIAAGMVVWADTIPGDNAVLTNIGGWLGAHMGAAILSYGFVTLGAIASGTIILRERALKQRKRSFLTDRLPSISTTEKTEIFGLAAAEIALGLAILFGIGAEYAASGSFFQITHKSLLTLITFAVIGILLWLHLKKGIRGRLVARVGLTVYLLISLGYPGVKFVGDVLLS